MTAEWNDLAGAIEAARSGGYLLDARTSEQMPQDIAECYQVQDQAIALSGISPRAWKLGAPALAAQAAMGLAEPFSGPVLPGMVMPSPAELQSIATLEAMASARPVVAVDAGALKELCQDDRNGYLCKQDDVQQIADSLVKILQDEKLQKRFGAESLAIARTHDIETTLSRFEAIYTQLINA